MLLKRVKVVARTEPVPSAEQIRATSDQKFFDILTTDDEAEVQISDRQQALAKRLAARDDSARTISRLLALARFSGPTEPREIRRTERGVDRSKPPRERERQERAPVARASNRDRPEYPARERADSGASTTPYRGAQREGGDWVSFRITWGGQDGADARKLLAMVCRWGEIRGSDVGAIEIERDYSRLSVKAKVAAGFAEATSKPDARNPRVTIQADQSNQGFAPRTMPPPRAASPARDLGEASVPRQPARALEKKREASVHSPAARVVRGPVARGPAPREAVAAPRTGGFPREASRPRAVTGYPRDAKKRSVDQSRPGAREGTRPHPAPREARPTPAARPGARALDATPPRDGGEPPRRRRVVTR